MQSDELAERVSEIRERCEGATEGPWSVYHGGDRWAVCTKRSGGSDEIAGLRLRNVGEDGHAKDNAELVAHSRSDLPDLLSVLDDVAEGLAGLHPNDDGWEALLFNVEHIGRIDEDVAGTLDAVRDLHQRREGEGG